MKIKNSLQRLSYLIGLTDRKNPRDTYIFFYHKLSEKGKLLVARPMLYVNYYSSCWLGYENIEKIAYDILLEKTAVKCNWNRDKKFRDSKWGKIIKDINPPLRYHIEYIKKDIPWSNMKPVYIRLISNQNMDLTKERFKQYKSELLNMLNGGSTLEAEITANYEGFLDRTNELPRVAELKAKGVAEDLINKLK